MSFDPTSISSPKFFPVTYLHCQVCREPLTKEQAVTHECSPAADRPIPSQGGTMPKTVKDLVRETNPATTEPPRIQETAQQYADLKAEADRLDRKLAKLKVTLDAGLKKLPDGQVEVEYDGDRQFLYRSESASKSFDWEAAKETLSKAELAKLMPFVKVTEKFELKAASELLPMDRFKKFIETKTSVALRFRPVKGDDN